LHQFILWCDGRICDVFVPEVNGVAQPFGFGAFDVAVVHAVVFW
jgi:hypothetical protein